MTLVPLIRVDPLPGLRLRVEFADGATGDVSLAAQLNGPMLVPLRDPAFFAEVQLVDGAPTWPNGVDWAPDALYAAVRRR